MMELPTIIFERRYQGSSGNCILREGLFEHNQKYRRLSIVALQSYFNKNFSDSGPISSAVEAQWPDRGDPKRRLFCGATYDFDPKTGTVIARHNVIKDSKSTVDRGTVIHPNVVLHNSHVGKNCEISNASTLIDSRVGAVCIIGAHTVLDTVKVLASTVIPPETILKATSIITVDRDYNMLRAQGVIFDDY